MWQAKMVDWCEEIATCPGTFTINDALATETWSKLLMVEEEVINGMNDGMMKDMGMGMGMDMGMGEDGMGMDGMGMDGGDDDMDGYDDEDVNLDGVDDGVLDYDDDDNEKPDSGDVDEYVEQYGNYLD